MHTRSFVTNVHDLDFGRDQGIKQRHDVIARQGKTLRYTKALQRPGDDVGSAKHAHYYFPLQKRQSVTAPAVISHHCMVGITKSAPARIPVGQRLVIVFNLV